MRISSVLSALAALVPAADSFTTTDFPQDGDVPQSGYMTNHNFDPAKLGHLKLDWTATFGAAETFYAKPLVYTPAGSPFERVYVLSNQNIVRVLDGKTGAVLVSRTLNPPFQASDSNCGDISNAIGIIGTPIIDTNTDLMYFWSKSYINGNGGAQGVAKGNWKLYAVHLSDLSDAPGFPISIQGMNAYNDRARYIISGTLNQRPGLAMVGNTIVTAFGSHCDNFNFTGFLITASKTEGVGITDIQAMVAAPGAPTPQALDIQQQRNGKSGIWQAGFGLAVDTPNNRIFFATGNGQSPGELKGDVGAPRSGKSYVSTLENAVASYGVDPNSGKLTQRDWFCPTNYDHLNGADRDVGSSGVALLDPATFSGGGVNRIAVAAGKAGTVFVMDADNLGGFKNGPGQTDGVLQIIAPNGASFFSGVASYPLEGGYIYFVPTGDSIYAYKFGIANGKPHFTYAGKTAMTFAGKGAPYVTTLNGQPGTGVLWISDVNQGVVAHHAVPDSNGVLQPYINPNIGRLNKFQRPTFGNARIYTSSGNKVLAMGAGNAPPASTIGRSTTAATSSSGSSTKSTSNTITKTQSTSSSKTSTTKTSTPGSALASTTGTTLSTQTRAPTATATDAFSYVGCYQDTKHGHAMPLLFANKSVTPELCGAYVESLAAKPTPTVFNYFFVEYHDECYGGSTFNWQGSAVTSLTGSKACTAICSGSVGAKSTGMAKCGGSKQFNLYAKGGSSNLPSNFPVPTTGAKSSTSVSSDPTSTPMTSSTSSKTLVTGTSTSNPAAYTTPAPPAGQTVTINWSLTWVNAAPDGFTRPMIGVNGKWPCPPIVLNYGDTLILNVYNGLGNESSAIHFHGLEQRGTTYADGPTFGTQCPIPPGNSFVYQFQARQIGTFWYHAHHAGQYIDGLRGPFIIKNPSPPYGPVDQDIALTLGDHYHKEAPYLINYYQSAQNTDDTGGSEPVPDAALINEAQNVKFSITPGQTNLFRIINVGALAGQWIQFDQHIMTIVEVDGQYVQPYDTEQVFLSVAQRISVIVKSKSVNSQNFAIVAKMNTDMFDQSALPNNPTVAAWLVYNAAKSLPTPFDLDPQPWNDLALAPLDQKPLLDPADQTLYFAADFGTDDNGVTKAFLNGQAYVNQKVPTLYTVLSAPLQYVNDSTIYGIGSNPYVLPFGSIIELDITNHDERAHPFHLHGHTFQVIYRSDNGPLWPGLDTTPATPLKRDTIIVYPQGTATLRFVADNPGIQLFHCHTEWHVVGGMVATFIEAPQELAKQKPTIPKSHKDACAKQKIPMKGNAAGNTKDWLDLTGANTESPAIQWGALTTPPP